MKSKKSNRSTLASLFLVVVIDSMGIGLIFPVLGPVFMELHTGVLPVTASLMSRYVAYGVTIGTFSLCTFFGAPFLGELSDYLGRKKVLFFCLLVTILAFLTAAAGIFYRSFGLLLLGRALGGLMAGSQPIAQAAIADISTHESKAKNLGLMSLAGTLGFVVGPMIGGYFSNHRLVSWFSHYTPFLIGAGLALINAIWLLITFSETFYPSVSKIPKPSRAIYNLIDAFKYKNIRTLSLVLLLSEFGWALYFQVAPLLLVQQYHATSEKVGLFMTYMGLVFTLSLTVVMRIMLRIFELSTIVWIGLLITIMGMLGITWQPAEWMQWACVLPISLGSMLSYSTLITLFSHSTGSETQGWIMGIANAVGAVSWLMAGMIAGVFGYFSPILSFFTAAVMILMAALFMRK